MATRFDPATFASVFSQVLTGQMAGKMRGEEIRQQKMLEEALRDQQNTIFQQGQEDREQAQRMAPFNAMMPHIGRMSPESQARLIEGLANAAGRPTRGYPGTSAAPRFSHSPMGWPGAAQPGAEPVGSDTGSAPTPAPASPPELGATADQVRMAAAMQGAEQVAPAPEIGSIFGYQPSPFFQMPQPSQPQPFAPPPPGWSPEAPPSAAPAPAAPVEAPGPDLTINSPVGDFNLTGLDPKAVVKAQSDWQAVIKPLMEANLTAQEQADLRRLISGVNTDPKTAEELADLRQAIRTVQASTLGRGPRQESMEGKKGKETRAEVDADIDQFKAAPPGQALSLLLNLDDRITEFEKTGGKRGVGFRLIGHRADIQNVRSLVQQAEETSDPEVAARLRQRAEREAKNIQGRVTRGHTPDQENKLLDKAFRMIRTMSTEELANQGGARKVFENLGIGHLVEGIDSNFAGAKLEERWDKILRQVAGLAGKDEGTQKLVLGEAQQIARLLGKKVKLPAKVWKKLNELEKSRLARSRQLIEIEGDKQERADVMLQLARNREQRAQQRHRADLAKLKKGGADVKPATELYKRWRAAEKGVDDLTTMFGVTESEDSWEDAGLEPHEMDELRDAIALRDSSGSDYDGYLTSRGVKITDPMQQPVPAAPAPTPAPAGGPVPASRIPPENRGAASNRAVARAAGAPARATAKGPFTNYREGFNYYRKKYPTASKAYIDSFLAKKGYRP
jgi:hypothetical protein